MSRLVADWDDGRLSAPGDDPDANSDQLADRQSRFVRDICARRAGFERVGHRLWLSERCEGLPGYQHALVASAAADLVPIRNRIIGSMLGGKLSGSSTFEIADLDRSWAEINPAGDRELIELCAKVDRLERSITRGLGGATLAEERKRDRAVEPFRKAQRPLLKRVVRICAPRRSLACALRPPPWHSGMPSS